MAASKQGETFRFHLISQGIQDEFREIPAPGKLQRIPSTCTKTLSMRGKPLGCTLPCQSAMPHLSIPSKSSRSISSWVGWWAWVLLGATGWQQGLLTHRSPIPSGTHVESTQEHPAAPFQAGFVQEGVERGRTWLTDPPQAKDSSRCCGRNSCARTSWSGLGPCHANVAHWDCGTGRGRTQVPPQSRGCFRMQPPRASHRAGGQEELGGQGSQSGCTVPQSHAHAILPGCHSDGCSTSHPPQVQRWLCGDGVGCKWHQ